MNIIITEKEIKDNPKYFQLGKLVSEKYWEVKSVKLDNNYITEDGFDKCVVCGKKSPYYAVTDINIRIGYVEGAGQGCFQPDKCDNIKYE